MSWTYDELGLKTLPRDSLIPPTCRMQNAEAVVDAVDRAIQNDDKRSRKRAAVDGLVDGNPPQNPRKLRDLGFAKATNTNFGTARSFLESGAGAVYDLFSQAPGFVQVEISHGSSEDQIKWGRIMSEELDYAYATDDDWDLDMQLSQNEMILHGNGPLFFEDNDALFPISVATENFKVPDLAPSKPSRWELAFILFNYYPPDLYRFIADDWAAANIGWNVPFTKKVIANAMDEAVPDNQNYNWEWFANQLKSNSLQYTDNQTLVSKMAHVFWREFPLPREKEGRITHAIVERTNVADTPEFCFLHVGRYKNFKECLHPMYYDRGRAGLHHNITGLGVKMYAAMHLENLFYCRLADAAMSPKTLFTTTTEDQFTKSLGAQLSENGILRPGVNPVQNPIGGFVTEGLQLARTTADLMRSNLSQYRQPVAPDKPGNPDTATEARMKASQQAAVSITQYNRYYKQLDLLDTEIARRAFNLNTTDPRAKAIQERCRNRGVPEECFGRIKRVQHVRVVGQGSPYMRSQATAELYQIAGTLPEDGRRNLIDDFIASRAGYSAVARYNPKTEMSTQVQDQKVLATLQVIGMKDGVPPVFSPSQSAITFAGVFLGACADALASLQKGGDPQSVLAFLELAGPAAHAHITRLQGDPLRKEVADMLMRRWERIGKVADQLRKKVQEQAKQQQAQRQKAQAVLTDTQIHAGKVQADIALKKQKQDAVLAMQREKHGQTLAIADATAASQIRLNQMRSLSE